MICNYDWRDTIQNVRDEADGFKDEVWEAYTAAREKGYEFSENIGEQYTDVEMLIEALDNALALLEERKKK